ncbi:hypothetical protein F2Q69_00036826 [Brassica cretica]|uniref:Reverse transcriptase zinc-binding domain-containing protein n=1 Tax=Brassica cretica TaxID=69181 RepID=A0A8S9SB98_BRACR|nr:hypothetical protein F2Q69_00036826 [Brassica cretica]
MSSLLERSEKQVQIQVFLSTITLTEAEDQYMWEMNGLKSTTFSTGAVYKAIKHHNPLNHLLSWGLNTPSTCLLCNSSDESRNHLFFECVYSSQVWHNIGNRSGLTISSSWDQTLTALHHLSGPRHAKLLPLFTWQSTIYYIWSERNARLHRNTYRPPDSISNSIGSYIKSKIVEIRTSSPRLSSSFFQLWHR